MQMLSVGEKLNLLEKNETRSKERKTKSFFIFNFWAGVGLWRFELFLSGIFQQMGPNIDPNFESKH